jgi:hypothetical protein
LLSVDGDRVGCDAGRKLLMLYGGISAWVLALGSFVIFS